MQLEQKQMKLTELEKNLREKDRWIKLKKRTNLDKDPVTEIKTDQ